MGDSTLDVLRRYRAAGFRLPTDWRDLPDHIAVELLFMRSLADAEAEGWRREEPDSARGVAGEERQFVEDHLLPWVPEFCAAVAQASRLPCFRRATGDLRELLPRDHDWLLALTAGVP
jgi:TorA maturation chaperone TorD